MKQFTLVIALCVISISPVWAQRDINKIKEDISKRAFNIDENSEKFDMLSQAYGGNLLTVNEFDYGKMQHDWLQFLRNIENTAKKQNVNLSGNKIWFKVFWNESGKIDYIGYNLLNEPKGFTEKALLDFLSNYIENVANDKPHSEKYSMYAIGEFPVVEQH